MRRMSLLLGPLLAAALTGCASAPAGDASPSSASTAPATAAPMSAYVSEVNKLCAQLQADFLGAIEPRPGEITIEDYKAEQPKVEALLDEFDAKVDAIAVSDAHRPASVAFDAFRRMSDETDAKLAAAAATGDQAAFDAAVEERHRTFDASSVLEDLRAAGIGCNAR